MKHLVNLLMFLFWAAWLFSSTVPWQALVGLGFFLGSALLGLAELVSPNPDRRIAEIILGKSLEEERGSE